MSLGALTTTFTLPSFCAESFQHVYATQSGSDGPYIFARGPLFSSAGTSCFPSGYKPDRSSYYSPGFCPSGYTPAYSSSAIIKGNVEETTVVCCPSVSGERYFYDTRREPFGFEIPYACKWEFEALTTPMTHISADVTQSTNTVTIESGGGAINAHGYQIRFQATDTLTPSSASLGPTASVSLAPTSTSPPNNSSGSSGLSTGGAAAIGVVCTIIVIALVFAAFYFGRRSRRRKEAAVSNEQGHGGSSLNSTNGTTHAGGDGQHQQQPQQKYYYTGVPVEMGVSPTVGELPLTEITTSVGNAEGRDTRRPGDAVAPVELDVSRQ